MSTHNVKQIFFAAGTALALILLLPGLALADPQAKAAIADRLQQYEARFNQGNAEAVAKLFSDDVVYYDPTGQVHEGREAVQQLYERNIEAGFRDMTIETIEITVFGNNAYDIARYTVLNPAGETLTGYHLAILAKEDGKWTVQRTLVNTVMPESPDK